jgi:hypothetical protein
VSARNLSNQAAGTPAGVDNAEVAASVGLATAAARLTSNKVLVRPTLRACRNANPNSAESMLEAVFSRPALANRGPSCTGSASFGSEQKGAHVSPGDRAVRSSAQRASHLSRRSCLQTRD